MSCSIEREETRRSRRRILKLGAGVAVGAVATGLGLGHGPRGLYFARGSTTSLNAKDFGALGDGIRDDAAALQAAIDEAARLGLPLLIPQGTYSVGRTVRAASNLTINADGATLRTAFSDLGDSGRIAATLMIDDVHDVAIVGLGVNGRRASWGHSEFKAGICVNASTNVTIEDCDVYDCMGDGLIFYAHSLGDRNITVTVRNTACRGNYRNALTINDLTGARFSDCRFTETNGTSPMAGVDFEPDSDAAWINDIEFHRCEFTGNGNAPGDDGAGVTVYLRPNPANPQQGIHFYDCSLSGNMIMGAILYHSRDVGFHNCDIRNNGSTGITIARTSRDILIEGGTIAGNQVQGISAIRDTGHSLTGLEVRDVTIRDNSQAWLKNYDGIHLKGSCGDVLVDSNTVTGSHRYGVWAATTVTSLRLVGNNLSGNAVGPVFPTTLVNESGSSTSTPTRTPTKSPTRTPTRVATKTPTENPSRTPTKKPTRTPTRAPSRTPTTAAPSSTPKPTRTPTRIPTKQSTKTPTRTRTPTRTPTKKPTRTATSSRTTRTTRTPRPTRTPHP